MWTEARCCEAGYLEFPTCQWCHQAIGNRQDHLYCCKRSDEIGGLSLAGNLKVQGRTADENSHRYVDLIPLGQNKPPIPSERKFQWVGEQVIFTGEVFGDGSAKGLAGFKRAGSAFGMLVKEGEGAGGTSGGWGIEGGWSTVRGEDHSSGDAELAALEQVVVRSLPPVPYITDSMLIVRGVRRGVAWTTRVTEVYADVWWIIWDAVAESLEEGDSRQAM